MCKYGDDDCPARPEIVTQATIVQELHASATRWRALAAQHLEEADRLESLAHQFDFKCRVATIVRGLSVEERKLISFEAILHIGTKRWDVLNRLDLVCWSEGWTPLGLAVREALKS